jgi:hypothetical protein
MELTAEQTEALAAIESQFKEDWWLKNNREPLLGEIIQWTMDKLARFEAREQQSRRAKIQLIQDELMEAHQRGDWQQVAHVALDMLPKVNNPRYKTPTA